ncbi:MAG: quinolinate synthase NadA [Syntrophobacteraceae bacterium]|nr:quinolinate synthase NadA [Desulfobacteraceae bacterium]
MKDDIKQQLTELKAERKAVILAHNYQSAEIQEIADMLGDSLELSRKASAVDAEVIVFCGVAFMAETAAVLNPGKTVLLPRREAGCPMADMITPEDVIGIRKEYPGVPIITYVNSTAAVKAESTVCCTSANVLQVVESFRDADTVYLAPDQNLAKYAARHTRKKVLHWNGYCPIHHNLLAEDVVKVKRAHPEAPFLAHPECRPEVLDLADEIRSTSGMLRFVRESSLNAFIIGTEEGILTPMQRENPHKRFYTPEKRLICQDMKLTTPEDVVRALQTLQPRITVPEETRVKALQAVECMLALG